MASRKLSSAAAAAKTQVASVRRGAQSLGEAAGKAEKALATNVQQPGQVFSSVGRGLVGGGHGPLGPSFSGPIVSRGSSKQGSIIKPEKFAAPPPHVHMQGTNNSYADMFTMRTPASRPGMGSRVPFGPPNS